MKIRLHHLFQDGMVLQRDAAVKVWGWAPMGSRLSVRFLGEDIPVVADEQGAWSVSVNTCGAGGPHTMEITSSDPNVEPLAIRDVLLGDVWLCSGQSNMEMRMESVRASYPEVISGAQNRQIRQFAVPVAYRFDGESDDYDDGCWQSVSPETIGSFSAVAYFFAQSMFDKYHVPIGLIVASLGGSTAESWMSEEAISGFPAHLAEARRLSVPGVAQELAELDLSNMRRWQADLDAHDPGLDMIAPYYAAEMDNQDWREMEIPINWERAGLGEFFGSIWLRRNVWLPGPLEDGGATLRLGNIVDMDTVWINGVRLGATDSQYPERVYSVPGGVLKAGANLIAVRIITCVGRGGLYLGKPYCLEYQGGRIDLTGKWRYRVGVSCEKAPDQAFVQWKPTGLYRSMIAPMIPYTLRGMLWYQGESNTGRAAEYQDLMKALIVDRRTRWRIPDLPFLIVQLPNYGERKMEPSESEWAQLREAQNALLSISKTGMAVTYDVGEWNDIHPKDKRSVGMRLALVARRVQYGETDIVAYGPSFQSAKRDGKRIVITFRETGSGLVSRNGGDAVHHFAIAGTDGVFRWGDARISQNTVIVSHDEILEPVCVRYAWADNPEDADLCNQEGLPAWPFEWREPTC